MVKYFTFLDGKDDNDYSTKTTGEVKMARRKKLFYYTVNGSLANLNKVDLSEIRAISENRLPKQKSGECSIYCEHIDLDLEIGEKRDIAILDPIFLGTCKLVAKDERFMMKNGLEKVFEWRNSTSDGNVWTWRLPKKFGGKLVFVPQNQTTEAKNAKN